MTDKRRFIEVFEGSADRPRVRSIEVCMECGKQAPMGGDNPDRVCKGCDDGRNGRWISRGTNTNNQGAGHENP